MKHHSVVENHLLELGKKPWFLIPNKPRAAGTLREIIEYPGLSLVKWKLHSYPPWQENRTHDHREATLCQMFVNWTPTRFQHLLTNLKITLMLGRSAHSIKVGIGNNKVQGQPSQKRSPLTTPLSQWKI